MVLKDASITIQEFKFIGDFEVLELAEENNFLALLEHPWFYANNDDSIKDIPVLRTRMSDFSHPWMM